MNRSRLLWLSITTLLLVASCGVREQAEGPAQAKNAELSLNSLRCVQPEAGRGCALYSVSMLELITQPREWHGKRVRVIGYVHFHDEENQLYTSAEDWYRLIESNSLRIPPSLDVRDSLNHRDVLIEATFDAGAGGSLKEVTRIESWGPFRPRRWEDIPKVDLSNPPH
jgi:hypothetical protein